MAVCVSLDLVLSLHQRLTGTSKSKKSSNSGGRHFGSCVNTDQCWYIHSMRGVTVQGTLWPVTGLCYSRLRHRLSFTSGFTLHRISSIYMQKKNTTPDICISWTTEIRARVISYICKRAVFLADTVGARLNNSNNNNNNNTINLIY